MAKTKATSEEFLLYRIEMLEKRIEHIENEKHNQLINLLLNLIDKQNNSKPIVSTQESQASNVTVQPSKKQERQDIQDSNEPSYEDLISSFSRRRTFV